MGYDLSQLNAEQLLPVYDTEGAVLVTAGAGSGKTRLLTHRIAYLVTEKGVDPYNILAITFTNKAANEMLERLNGMIPNSEQLWVSTFHSMCVSMLRRYIDSMGYSKNFSIYAEAEKERVVKSVIQKIESLSEKDDDFYKKVMWSISDAKNKGLSPKKYALARDYDRDIDDICRVYELYEENLRASNALDFDDLLLKTVVLLSVNEEAKAHYHRRFRYIHVDEFQDTNEVQYKLIKILAEGSGNIFCVGDEDQCIYGWRGANINNILDFRREFECRVYKLEQNYRSTKRIIAVANQLISHNSSRLEKLLWTDGEDGVNVENYAAYSETEEADYVVGCINGLMDTGNYSYSDFAILMRVNALSRPFEERLTQYGLPHKIFGGFKFYERAEIKNLIAYLRMMCNHFDNEALLRIINFPKRGIGDTSVAQLVNYSLVTNEPLFEIILNIESNPDLPMPLIKKLTPFSNLLKCLGEQAGQLSPDKFVRFLIKAVDLKTAYSADTEENESRKMNIREFVNSVEQYMERNPEAALEEFLQNIMLYSDTDDIKNDECVNIATVHSAKGLEFKTVFIVGCEDGLFPISRAVNSLSEMEEERRLMYVAITRAQKRLYVTHSKSRFMYGERKYTIPSRFLSEAGLIKETVKPSDSDRNERVRYSGGEDVSVSAGNSRGNAGVAYTINREKKADEKDISGYVPGRKVRHRRFGEGTILALSNEAGGGYAEIEFDGIGKMTLALKFAPLELV